MAQVFVSYSHLNVRQVGRIVDGLKAEGYSLWWDERLRSADDYGRDIEAALDQARCVVVVWSSSARNSLWVRAEANAALEQDKLVQVAADSAKPPLPFTMLQLLDLSRWRGDREALEWQKLPESINSVITRQDGPLVRYRSVDRQGAFLAPEIAVGVGSLGLIALVAGLTIAMLNAPGGADIIGSASFAAFAAASLGLGYMLLRIVEIGLASRGRA